jgi:hypothetical protein
MHSGPPSSNSCSIDSRVTSASRPFSEAGPTRSRQATITGRAAEAQARQTRRKSLPRPLPSMA